MERELATFAGGCFWCMVQPFDELPGIIRVTSGYTGGHMAHPSYEQVCAGITGHTEAVEIEFDPQVISYSQIVELYWQQIDPTDAGGQFADRGQSYRTAIFYHSDEQKKAAWASRRKLEQSGRFHQPIVTPILPAKPFYPAEEEHQHYYKKRPQSYHRYKVGSGRSSFLQKHWGQKQDQLREQLTKLQYEVTQQNGTEPPFSNEFWNHWEEGIYVDVISGQPLFSSLDKFDAQCGWPSFTKPIADHAVKEALDRSHGMLRTEVRSTRADAHLGHMFTDGPAPTGLRYCMNSAALRFIPRSELEQAGYSEYVALFSKN